MLFSRVNRGQRRLQLTEYWNAPLTRWRRVHAYLNMIFVDHGLFRYAYLNLHEIVPNVFRSAQPAPHHLKRLARRGIKTVVVTRAGTEFGSWPLEVEACAATGMQLQRYIVTSRALPSREQLLEAPAFFASLQLPVLFHCKSGADRAGFIATLYLLVHEGRPVAEALQQLHWRYGHFKSANTGVLDAFFETYARDGEAKGIPFLDWVRHHYDKAAIEGAFKSRFAGHLIADTLLRRE